MSIVEAIVLCFVFSILIGIAIAAYFKAEREKTEDPCGAGRHLWSEWSDPFQYPRTMFAVYYQRRKCSRCGEVVDREIS